MTPDKAIGIERELIRARLLITRGAYDEARALLKRLSQAGVPPHETDRLLEEIGRPQNQIKAAEERRREWRYNLGLQTWTARIGWFMAAVAAAIYAVWNGNIATGMGLDQGFTTVITTQIHDRSGSHPWTRPIYVDVIYSLVVFAVAITAMTVIVWVSKGAAQWEEIDTPNPTSRYG